MHASSCISLRAVSKSAFVGILRVVATEPPGFPPDGSVLSERYSLDFQARLEAAILPAERLSGILAFRPNRARSALDIAANRQRAPQAISRMVMIGNSRFILESPPQHNNENHYHHYSGFESKIKRAGRNAAAIRPFLPALLPISRSPGSPAVLNRSV